MNAPPSSVAQPRTYMAVLVVLAVTHLLNDLIQGRVGLIGGLFYGLNFGLAGIAAAILGGLADSIGIESVYRLCAFLPLAGLLTWFLPRIEDGAAGERKALLRRDAHHLLLRRRS